MPLFSRFCIFSENMTGMRKEAFRGEPLSEISHLTSARLRSRAVFRYCTSAPPCCAYPVFEFFPVPTAEIAPPMSAGAALWP